ncbi:NAD(P)H-dependent glycerol-3-phosphate dehydrogenase [Roseobacter sp. HKCCD5988]|uniref:NAD(P)H-dependent glycerol-3-phosphate dehydrogenase n=1 Tax=Roseobacter sp. HKCCD5988 TaxID=3120338 RepID=UPI0030EC630B
MIDIAGAGAFGTSLAIALARAGRPVRLWARNGAENMRQSRENAKRLPDIRLPDQVEVTEDLDALRSDILLVAIPTQKLGLFLDGYRPRAGHLVSCAKGIDLTTGLGPASLLSARFPDKVASQLTGPSFAVDIARGLPTALTLACQDATAVTALQKALSTPNLRLYGSTDVIGAEMGGALKNVIAIGAGAVIGRGLGESARAAFMARGFAEMRRIAHGFGAIDETLSGLSGLGDLILTCTSEKSRNMRFGLSLTQGTAWSEDSTVEGVATARGLAARAEIDTPLVDAVAKLSAGEVEFDEITEALLARPLTME